jgi:Protein of unknown function (DUF3489)
MDVIGRAATLYRKRGFQAMLFHLTSEGDIRAINEQHAGEVEGGSIFASEQELQKLATEWPMKRLVAIWNHLPGVQPVTRFTDRKTAIARIWRAIQPQTEADRSNARRTSKAQHQPVFREGSKAAQVLTLLSRPEGATLNEIRNQTGWQAHTVRGFISRNLSKQSRKVRSFERDGERVYRLKM